MMQYSMNKAIELFDKVIDKGADINPEVFWKTKTQKMLLFSQIGRSKESVASSLDNIKNGSDNIIDWRCLIQAFIFDNDIKNAYEYFIKASKKFPDDSIIYTLGGNICEKSDRFDEALLYWDKAIELDDSCDAKYSKLNYYVKIGEKEKCKNISAEIVEELKKVGLDIEAAAEEKRLKNLIK